MARVFITTRGRPDNQITLAALHGEATLVVTHKSDAPKDADYIVVPANNLTEKRAYLMNKFGGAPMILADDDLRFYRRMMTGKYERVTDARPAIEHMRTALKKHDMVGVIPKFMSHLAPRGLKIPARINHIVGFNLKERWRPEYRLPLGQDHDVTLQMVAHGCSVAAITSYAQDDKQYSPGGVQIYRTREMELEQAEALRALWPDYVTLNGHRPKIQLMKLWKEVHRA